MVRSATRAQHNRQTSTGSNTLAVVSLCVYMVFECTLVCVCVCCRPVLIKALHSCQPVINTGFYLHSLLAVNAYKHTNKHTYSYCSYVCTYTYACVCTYVYSYLIFVSLSVFWLLHFILHFHWYLHIYVESVVSVGSANENEKRENAILKSNFTFTFQNGLQIFSFIVVLFAHLNGSEAFSRFVTHFVSIAVCCWTCTCHNLLADHRIPHATQASLQLPHATQRLTCAFVHLLLLLAGLDGDAMRNSFCIVKWLVKLLLMGVALRKCWP